MPDHQKHNFFFVTKILFVLPHIKHLDVFRKLDFIKLDTKKSNLINIKYIY